VLDLAARSAARGGKSHGGGRNPRSVRARVGHPKKGGGLEGREEVTEDGGSLGDREGEELGDLLVGEGHPRGLGRLRRGGVGSHVVVVFLWRRERANGRWKEEDGIGWRWRGDDDVEEEEDRSALVASLPHDIGPEAQTDIDSPSPNTLFHGNNKAGGSLSSAAAITTTGPAASTDPPLAQPGTPPFQASNKLSTNCTCSRDVYCVHFLFPLQAS
jgi:hypothetical protein